MFHPYANTAAEEVNTVPLPDSSDALLYAASSKAGPVGATKRPWPTSLMHFSSIPPMLLHTLNAAISIMPSAATKRPW